MRVLLTKKVWLIAVLSVGIAMIYLVLFAVGLLPPYRKDVIYIAVVGPLSGAYVSDGQAMVNATQLYIDRVNREGGVNGKPVKLVVFDDEGDSRG